MPPWPPRLPDGIRLDALSRCPSRAFDMAIELLCPGDLSKLLVPPLEREKPSDSGLLNWVTQCMTRHYLDSVRGIFER